MKGPIAILIEVFLIIRNIIRNADSSQERAIVVLILSRILKAVIRILDRISRILELVVRSLED